MRQTYSRRWEASSITRTLDMGGISGNACRRASRHAERGAGTPAPLRVPLPRAARRWAAISCTAGRAELWTDDSPVKDVILSGGAAGRYREGPAESTLHGRTLSAGVLEREAGLEGDGALPGPPPFTPSMLVPPDGVVLCPRVRVRTPWPVA